MVSPADIPVELPVVDVPTLNASHRCDTGCPAQARVRVFLRSGLELLFCKHHWEAQPDSILAAVDSVVNECRFI